MIRRQRALHVRVCTKVVATGQLSAGSSQMAPDPPAAGQKDRKLYRRVVRLPELEPFDDHPTGDSGGPISAVGTTFNPLMEHQ
jgi:hypothetical protein